MGAGTGAGAGSPLLFTCAAPLISCRAMQGTQLASESSYAKPDCSRPMLPDGTMQGDNTPLGRIAATWEGPVLVARIGGPYSVLESTRQAVGAPMVHPAAGVRAC